MNGLCHICGRKFSDRYENLVAGEACIDPCHWPYLNAYEVAVASRRLDRVRMRSERELNDLASEVAVTSRKNGSPINAYHARASVDAELRLGRDPYKLLDYYGAAVTEAR